MALLSIAILIAGGVIGINLEKIADSLLEIKTQINILASSIKGYK